MVDNPISWLFQQLTNVIRSASPAIFTFVETTLPYTTPMPVALISSASAATFFGLEGLGAFLFVYSLEAIGLVATSKLVETVVDFINSRNAKTFIMIVVLVVVVGAYITILVSLNVKMHKEIVDADWSQALTLVCYLPLLAGILNGMGLIKIEHIANTTNEQKLKELHYQQNHDAKVKLKALDKGVNLFQTGQQSTPDTSVRREKHASDYQEKIVGMLADEYRKSGNILSPSGICHTLKLDPAKNKGHVFRITSRWKQENGIP